MKLLPIYYFLIILFSLVNSNLAISKDKIVVPSGPFNMGCSVNDSNCDVDEGPLGGIVVQVPEFKIDKNEVTVNQYKKCISAGKCARPKDYKRNKYCNLDAPDRGNHPINCVDWQDSQSYCQWQSGRLPYEAEWEKAARAGMKSAYPTGKTIDCKNAILDDNKTTGSVKGEFDGCGEDRTWKIASRAANKFGIFDMHGNAGEWTANWYDKNAIVNFYSKGDLKAPSTGKRRIVRGGSWDENVQNLRNSYRNVKAPESGASVYGSIGFRCAYE